MSEHTTICPKRARSNPYEPPTFRPNFWPETSELFEEAVTYSLLESLGVCLADGPDQDINALTGGTGWFFNSVTKDCDAFRGHTHV